MLERTVRTANGRKGQEAINYDYDHLVQYEYIIIIIILTYLIIYYTAR